MLRVFQCLTCTSNTETAYSDTYLFVAVNACFSEHQDRVKSLFRAFAKIYVSEMTSFDAAPEAPSWHGMKGYDSEGASFSFCSANASSEKQCSMLLGKMAHARIW